MSEIKIILADKKISQNTSIDKTNFSSHNDLLDHSRSVLETTNNSAHSTNYSPDLSNISQRSLDSSLSAITLSPNPNLEKIKRRKELQIKKSHPVIETNSVIPVNQVFSHVKKRISAYSKEAKMSRPQDNQKKNFGNENLFELSLQENFDCENFC